MKAWGEGDDRRWDCWMISPTRWTWLWVSSGHWWWTGKPGVLQSIGLRRVKHDWATKVNLPVIHTTCKNHFAPLLRYLFYGYFRIDIMSSNFEYLGCVCTSAILNNTMMNIFVYIMYIFLNISLRQVITCRTVWWWDLYFFKVFDKYHVNTNFLVSYSTLEFYLSLKSMIIW